MTNEQVEKTLKETLGVTKEIVAFKMWKEKPDHIPEYEGAASPGICTQICEVLKQGKHFYTTDDHHFCQAGCVAAGIRAPFTDSEHKVAVELHQELSKEHKNFDLAWRYVEQSYKKYVPGMFREEGTPETKRNEAVELGLLREVKDPDLVIVHGNPQQVDYLHNAYAHLTGDYFIGSGGHSGCPFYLQYVVDSGKPTFGTGDMEWRGFVDLDDNELVTVFPYKELLRIIDEMPGVVQEYKDYVKTIRARIYKRPEPLFANFMGRGDEETMERRNKIRETKVVK
jgi:uncharacterized protein (DUF169 family)